MENKIIKPISVARAEFVSSLATIINNSGLPAFVLESILKDAHFELQVIAQKQLEEDRIQYEQALNATKQSTTDAEE